MISLIFAVSIFLIATQQNHYARQSLSTVRKHYQHNKNIEKNKMCTAHALRGQNYLTEKTFPLLLTSFYSYQQVNRHLYEWITIINC